MNVLLADLPNPLEAVGSVIGGAAGNVASKAAEATFEFFMKRLAEALANAAGKVVEEVLAYLDRSSGVSLDQGWFAGPRAGDILNSVLLFATVLMVLFLLAAVIQGLFNGDPLMMIRPALIEAPISVFGIVSLTAITAALLAITDSASSMVLAGAPADISRFLNFGDAGSILTLGLLGVGMLFVFIIGAVLVWIELVVRSSLIYLLLAFAPLVLAARVWPVLRGGWHQLCRFGIALIVSKFAISLALALGAAALAGGGPGSPGSAGPNPNSVGAQAGMSIGAVVVGASLMLLASFAPFVILKILPVFEAAVLAQGIGRGPMRAAQTAMQTAYYGQGLKRLAQGGGNSSRGDENGGGNSGGGNGSSGASASGSAGPSAAGSGGGATATPAGPAAGSGGAASAGGAAGGAGGGGAAAGGAAAAGPAAAAMVPVAVASKGRAAASGAADAKSTSPEGGSPA